MKKIPFIITCIFLTACSSPQYYIQGSEKFASATVNFSDAYQTYAKELYYITPAMTLEELALNPDMPLDGKTVDIIKNQRGFGQYDKKQLELRLALAQCLKDFSMTLLQIAQHDIATDFVSHVHRFNHSLKSLGSTIQSDTHYKSFSPKIEERSNAITGVIATIGQHYIEEKQAKILRHIILNTSDLMTDILETMKNDVVLFDITSSVVRDKRFFAVAKAYSKAQKQEKIFPFVHQFYAEKLQHQFNILRATETLPSDMKLLLTALQKAHLELIKLAKSDKKIENTSEMLLAIEDINTLSAKIKTAIQSLN